MRVLRPRADQGGPVIEAHTDWVEVAQFGFELVSALCVAVVTWINWGMRAVVKSELAQAKVDHEEVHEELERRLADGDVRFARIRADIEHLPDHHDLADLTNRVAAVEGSVKALGATLEGVRDVLARIERPLNSLVDHHLKGNQP